MCSRWKAHRVVTHDVKSRLSRRPGGLVARPGRIDSIYEVPLPPEREQDMKLSPEFTELKREILSRIRATSGMQTDRGMLEKLTATAQPGAAA